MDTAVNSNARRWADAIQHRIAESVEIYGRLALPFSGGLENCLLLHLAQPWKDQITVFTMNTGATFEHVERFINRTLTGWNRKSIQTDISKYLADVALPSQVFSLIDLLRSPLDLGSGQMADGRRIVTGLECCSHNRGFPGQQAIKDLNIRASVSDQIGGTWDEPRHIPSLDGVAVIAPMRGHSRPEIQEMISAFNVELPEHYPDFDAPHACSICPAALTPARQVWMAKLYPDDLLAAGTLSIAEAEAVRGLFAQRTDETAKVVNFRGNN